MHAKDVLGADDRQAAADYLQGIGFQILDRNWQQPEGWIDIVAVDHGTLVVCEVTTRSGARSGWPLAAMSQSKRLKLRKLAIVWLNVHGMRFDQIRVDIVGLTYEGTGGCTIEHVRGVG